MYTFIYSNIHSHGYEDVTISHRSTSKNPISLLNFPYIHSHIQSHILPGRRRGRRRPHSVGWT